MIIPELSRAGWAAPLFNHLWQSTLVLAAAWILTILLHRNPARVRYGIWMLASLKFLLPFALLVSVGEHWAKPISGKPVGSAIYTAADEFGQPFQNTPAALSQPGPHADWWFAFLPAMLAVVWFCGFLAILTIWLVR